MRSSGISGLTSEVLHDPIRIYELPPGETVETGVPFGRRNPHADVGVVILDFVQRGSFLLRTNQHFTGGPEIGDC
jgi:hypothetical protein